jgi:hypothetical protein
MSFCKLARWISCLALLVIFGFRVEAQTGSGGSIRGTVTDASHAVVAKAKITAINTSTGVTTETSTSSAGYYVLLSLVPGSYRVTAEMDGYQTYTQENITVNALQDVGINITLTIGSASEVVTVTAAPPELRTENASQTSAVENETYTALPLNMGSGAQRDPTAFAALTPGYSGGGRSGTYNGAGGSSNSSSDSGAVTYIDGLAVGQGDNRQVSLSVSVDAVDQFQVTSSGANAAQTGMGSQNYNVKHGTNNFHGSAYDFFRNTAFDSWQFLTKAQTVDTADGGTKPMSKPTEHQTEAGVTFGGPIVKNSMFFFVSGEIYKYTAHESPTLMTIPTKKMRTGDFSELDWKIYDPTTEAMGANGKYAASAFAYQNQRNVMDPGKISPIAQKMMALLPTPSNSDVNNNYLTNTATGNSNYEMTLRYDWTVTPKQRISILGNVGKKGYIGYDLSADDVLPAPFTYGDVVSQFMDSGILEHTYIFSENLVNQAKAGYIRMDSPVKASAARSDWAASAMGITNLPTGQAQTSFPAVTFTGGEYTQSTWYSRPAYSSTSNMFSFHDDLSWVHGKHMVTAGFDLQFAQKNASGWNTPSSVLGLTVNRTSTAGFVGTAANDNSLITKSGDPVASLLMGAIDSSSITLQNYSTLGLRQHPFSPYIQDDWKVSPKLTVNLGLRWDLIQPVTETLDRGSYMDANAINPATGNKGAIAYLGGANGHSAAHTYHANWAPRVGFAYSATPTTAISGSFGINYSRSGALNISTTSGTTGLTKKTSFADSVNGEQPAFYLNGNTGMGTLANTAIPAYATAFTKSASDNAGNYANNGSTVTAGSVTMADAYRGSRPPTVYNWNFGVQHALNSTMSFTVTYAGSASHFLNSSASSGVNYLDPKYLVIGKYLTGSATSASDLAAAQSRYAGLAGANSFTGFTGKQAYIHQMLRAFPQYSSVSAAWYGSANASYHALQASFEQRKWRDFSYSANFTWSKTMDNTGSVRAVGLIPAAVWDGGKDIQASKLEHSASTYDQPMVFHIYGQYKLPFGANKIGSNSKLVRAGAGGWQVSWIYSLSSGRPLSVGTSSGVCTTSGQGTCFASYNPNFSGSIRKNGRYGHGYLAGMSTATAPRYIDASGFVAPSGYRLGNSARTAPYGLRYDHTTNLSMGVMRTFDVVKAANVKFVFRAEVFNVTNHTEWKVNSTYPCALSGTDYGTGGGSCAVEGSSYSFGQVSSQSNDPRDWQFSGKFTF